MYSYHYFIHKALASEQLVRLPYFRLRDRRLSRSRYFFMEF
jgi:hypothetical protein